MNEIVCTGLDGANPLHALAAFGLLRVGHRIRGDSLRMSWRSVDGLWHPVVHGAGQMEALLSEVGSCLVSLSTLGNPDKELVRRVRERNADTNRLKKSLKERRKQAKAEAKASGFDPQSTRAHVDAKLATAHSELEALQVRLSDAQKRLAMANGIGVAHVGDTIGVAPEILRAAARHALDRWTADAVHSDSPATDDALLVLAQLPALACDQIHEDGRLTPTPFSFSNGASGQCLLKDFRGCAAEVTRERLLAAITGQGDARVAGQTGLNWDPDEQVSYALVWNDPSNATKAAPVATNALAYLGLSLVPCVPRGSRLAAVGWGPGRAFSWPIWDTPLPIDAAMALLAHPQIVSDRPDSAELRLRGIIAVRRAAVVNPTGKRNFFAPSRPVA